jgi:O-antigen ligase
MGNFEDNYYFFTDHWVGINHAVHSTWFGVLAEVGITGFIVYVLMVYMVYRRAYRQNLAVGAENWDPMMRAVAMGLLAGLAGYCVSATFLSQMYTWPMHIILALTIAAGQIAANWDLSREKAEAPREYKPQVWI